MFTLIENGDVYSPEPLGRVSVLLDDGTILKIGEVDASPLEKLGLPVEVIDASDSIVTAIASSTWSEKQNEAEMRYG